MRNTRNAGGEWRLSSSVSPSFDVQMSCFQFSCTGDSAALTMRVPICTPSAPSTNAAAIDRPSHMPPAAMIGTSTRDAISGSSTIVDAPVGALKPPPSLPSTTSPSTPASTAFSAPRSDGTTWNTVRPASFSARRELRRVAGRGGHERHAVLGDEVDDRRVAHEQLGDVDAERLVGERRASSTISSRTSLEPARRRLDDAEPARVRDRRRELGPGDVAHRRLHDRMLDSEQLCDSGAHGVPRYTDDRERRSGDHRGRAQRRDEPRTATPNVPATAEEQAKDALACVDAGATVIHTHAPNIVGAAEEAAEQYATAFRPVVEQHPGVVCYPTTGIGADDRGSLRATSSCSTTWVSSAPASSTPVR